MKHIVKVYDKWNNEIFSKERDSLQKAMHTAQFFCDNISERYAKCTDKEYNRIFLYKRGKFEW